MVKGAWSRGDGERLRTIREALGMTQVELAEKLGVNSFTLSRWETATNQVSLPRMLELALRQIAQEEGKTQTRS